MDLVSSKLPPDPLGVDNVLQGVASETELLTELDNLGEDAVAGCLIGGAGRRISYHWQSTVSLCPCVFHGERSSWHARDCHYFGVLCSGLVLSVEPVPLVRSSLIGSLDVNLQRSTV